ncbi:MAG: hypothetical protein KDD85_06540 [Parvularculaceae bacterium]|nr:hypothetical protein [Parvularculaceae bacterium]
MINLDGADRKAIVAWLSRGRAVSARVRDAAKTSKYRLVDPDESAAGDRFDIAVVDLRGVETDRTLANELLTRARRLAPTAGAVILASSEIDENTRAFLRRRGDVCFVGEDAAPVMAAIRERLRLSALVDEMGERVKSLVADGRPVSFARLHQEKQALRVLVAGAPSPLTLTAFNAVRAGAAQATCVFTAGQVMRALDHGEFDSAIFLPKSEGDLLFALARALRRHREYRSVPVLLACEDADILDRFLVRDGFDVIQAGHIEADLSRRIDLAARRARMAAAVRAFLRAPEGVGGGRGYAASARFFAFHATRIFQRADDANEAVSFAALQIRPQTADSVILEAAKTASRILRAEDMIARLAPGSLVVLLRGVKESEARRIAERLEGVIGGSLPRAAIAGAEIAVGAVQRHPGDDLEETIAALFRNLRSSSYSAAG